MCRQYASIKAPKLAVIVGVDIAANQDIAKSVHEDCEDFHNALIECGFTIHARLEGAIHATGENMLQAIRSMRTQALAMAGGDPTIVPVVLLVYAGHGIVENREQLLCTAGQVCSLLRL